MPSQYQPSVHCIVISCWGVGCRMIQGLDMKHVHCRYLICVNCSTMPVGTWLFSFLLKTCRPWQKFKSLTCSKANLPYVGSCRTWISEVFMARILACSACFFCFNFWPYWTLAKCWKCSQIDETSSPLARFNLWVISLEKSTGWCIYWKRSN